MTMNIIDLLKPVEIDGKDRESFDRGQLREARSQPEPVEQSRPSISLGRTLKIGEAVVLSVKSIAMRTILTGAPFALRRSRRSHLIHRSPAIVLSLYSATA